MHTGLRVISLGAWLAAGACGGGSVVREAGDASLSSGSASGDGRSEGGASYDAPPGANDGATDAQTDALTDAHSDAPTLPGWVLVWADEFDGPDGSAVDPTKWFHDVGGGGFGNQEREYYTDGTQNAVVQGGHLVITATTAGAAQHACWYGACRYTSARFESNGKFMQAYGRFEARIQIPFGQGLWPAFWMLGANIDRVPWPACGEIDVMENIGREPSMNHGSLHGQGYPPAGLTGVYAMGGGNLADSFHRYAVEWEPSVIRFYVDDQLYETRTPADVPAGSAWAFDHPFFLLLNLAVGGTWPGDPDATTVFPQTMKVDWVRVFQKLA